MNYKTGLTLFKNTFKNYTEDNMPRIAAALAYYAAFSIAPLLIVCIAIVGIIIGKDSAQGQIIQQISAFIGLESALQIQAIIKNASDYSSGLIATTISIATVVLGAAGLFWELQDGLNSLWGVKPKPQHKLTLLVKKRLFSFTIVLLVCFLSLASLILSSLLSFLSQYLHSSLPIVLEITNFLISLSTITFLFAVIFKFFPDVELSWHNVRLGAFITALLFMIGKSLLAFYFSRSSIKSIYGAAGSFVVILIWVYYCAQIFFIGAEFTKAYTKLKGFKIIPSTDAMLISQ